MEDNFGSFFKWCNANGIFVGRNGEGPNADFEFSLVTEPTKNGKTSCGLLILDYKDVVCDYLWTKTALITYFNISGCK